MASFPDKWAKLLGEFQNTADSMSDVDLRKAIVTHNNGVSEAEKERDADQDLTDAKETVKELALPYKERIKEHEARVRYCVFLLNERGTIGD